MRARYVAILILGLVAAIRSATAEESEKRPYSPNADRGHPTEVFFGETHVHSALSTDAGGGGTTLMPREIYRFARGEQVLSNTGQPVKLARPLDFVCLTEHTDGMGVITDILKGTPAIMADEQGKKYHEAFNAGGDTAKNASLDIIKQFGQGTLTLVYQPGNPGYDRTWADLVAAAEDYNDPHHFTALRDPDGANLDRIQIVKGWLDAGGKGMEKVYDVAWSGERKPGTEGKLPPVGDTVDRTVPTWKNTIGSPELFAHWSDPDIDPKKCAFYYVRALEIPTPRWTAYDAVRFNIEFPAEIPLKTQERAYTSPIWYTP